MSRLKKVAKPRTKKQEVVLSVKFTFEAFNDNTDEAKLDCKRFKQWMKEQFSEWDHSILQYFLYAYKLMQDADDDKYLLDMHIDKIYKDDSATMAETKEFMELLEEEQEEKEVELDELAEQYEKEIEDEIPIAQFKDLKEEK